VEDALTARIDIDHLIRQVRRNCDISDAHHAGSYSLCGLALRLRDLYKWHHRLKPWTEGEAADVARWIGEKESLWETLTDEAYSDIALNGTRYGTFETGALNRTLEPGGLFYGAGYAYGLKPCFFLAQRLTEETVAGVRVISLGRELARDLLTLPALLQEQTVLVRTEAAALYLWDQMLYVKPSGRPALQYAMAALGTDDLATETLRQFLPHLLAAQQRIFVHHEIGEMRDDTFDTDLWRQMVSLFAQTPQELYARALKDLLADTHSLGPLPLIVEEQNTVCLGLYAAFLDGLPRTLFPQLRQAFAIFRKHAGWGIIEDAIAVGRARAREDALWMSTTFAAGQEKSDPQWAAARIGERLQKRIDQYKQAPE
jgi:hypothetical protein